MEHTAKRREPTKSAKVAVLLGACSAQRPCRKDFR